MKKRERQLPFFILLYNLHKTGGLSHKIFLSIMKLILRSLNSEKGLAQVNLPFDFKDSSPYKDLIFVIKSCLPTKTRSFGSRDNSLPLIQRYFLIFRQKNPH